MSTSNVELRLPQLTDAMTSARIATWLKREGDAVVRGEPIAEVESDKTTVELEAPDTGVLRIQVPAGVDAAPGTVLALVAPAFAAAGAAIAPGVATLAPPVIVQPKPVGPNPPPASRAIARQRQSAVDKAADTASETTAQTAATPIALRMARVAGLDLAAIPAPDGTVTRRDVEAVLGRQPRQGSASGRAWREQPLTAMRRATGTRLQQTAQDIPHFYLQTDCLATRLVEMRREINAEDTDGRITITDLLVAVVAQALRLVPSANGEWVDGAHRVHDSIDIAVAVDTPRGLVTPVVRGCQERSLAAISRELRGLAERARAGTLDPAEYANGTFTISNLGMFGITGIMPIINPPQCCILGVGAVEERPVVEVGRDGAKDGATIVPGRVMRCTIAADHRALDGKTAGDLLAAIRHRIEHPLSLLGRA